MERAMTPTPDRYDAGMAVRRAVLGDAHVNNAVSKTTEFTADLQQLITEYAWGTIWTRHGLDRRARSIITLTALIARGHHGVPPTFRTADQIRSVPERMKGIVREIHEIHA
jgi:alkylhydroperoxidase/carboxymuconolactone decarboxylase family protein YurZ